MERKRITLEGYVPLLQNCPRLSQISVATACKSFDTRKALPPGLCNRSLTNIHFPQSSIESSAECIFRCLVLMFPNLQYPTTSLQKKHVSLGLIFDSWSIKAKTTEHQYSSTLYQAYETILLGTRAKLGRLAGDEWMCLVDV